MSNISDRIEKFILESIGDDASLDFSRNELADFFGCVPSQINYVLATRFNTKRGFIIESQKGGGGYTRIIKIDINNNSYISSLLNEYLEDEIDYQSYKYICLELYKRLLISEDMYKTLLIVGSPNTLSSPLKQENFLRSNILKNVICNLIKENNDG